jgi:hypothetical protein
VAPRVLRPTKSCQAFLPRLLAPGLVACAVAVLLVCCKGVGVDPSKWDWSAAPDLGAALIVHIQNSTAADFYGAGRLVPVGSDNQTLAYFKNSGALAQFDIARGGTDASNAERLARVVFRILNYPTGSSQDLGAQQHVTITVTEPSAGVFAATTFDTSWIEIVSVTPLP